MEGQLPWQLFLRIDKSYIITLGKISFVECNRVAIADQLLPASDSFKEAVINYINNLSSSQLGVADPQKCHLKCPFYKTLLSANHFSDRFFSPG